MTDDGRDYVNQGDVQGNVLCGYGNDFRCAWYGFALVTGPEAARGWLGRQVEAVTTAVPWSCPPLDTLNLAFTHAGLNQIGVPAALLKTFPKEFQEGMAEPARATDLGDLGDNDPANWDVELRGDNAPQVLVTVFARTPEGLEQRRDEIREGMEGSGFSIAHQVDAALLEHPAPGVVGREHFGFADGLAQPTIKGNAGPWERPGGGTPVAGGGWEPLAPGEFVLGYLDEDGMYPEGPVQPLGRNGSFTVVRKLHQDVREFRRFFDEASKDKPGVAQLLEAKMLGRWHDGTPLVLSPDAPDPEVSGDRSRYSSVNDFRYAESGTGPLACPLGAHVRRANPRDAFGWEGTLTRRHRIIRRGMPYGPLYDEHEENGIERGLMFVCHQASIARQFEMIQRRWLYDGDAFGLGADKDFLTSGAGEDGKMTIQAAPPVPPTFLSPQKRFVTLRGGGYFFTPGISALQALAAANWDGSASPRS
jgi:Dyp-type peroxidase family